MNNQTLYRYLYLIRRFEETVLEEFPRGRFYGTTHTYIGQEADAGVKKLVCAVAEGDLNISIGKTSIQMAS